MLIQLNNISKIYNTGYTVRALNDINLNIEEGESVAIMGASGSGKSTLLHIMGCMDRATGGEYYLNDIKISQYTEKQMAALRNECFGFVMQDFALIERETVLNNVMLPLHYSKRFKKNKKKRAEEILEQMGILEKKNQLAMRLSGGQRQRVAIARALVNDADILLCDEPTGALDKNTGEEIIRIFSELNQAGKTIIVVTHDEKVAASCKRVVEISDGRLITP